MTTKRTIILNMLLYVFIAGSLIAGGNKERAEETDSNSGDRIELGNNIDSTDRQSTEDTPPAEDETDGGDESTESIKGDPYWIVADFPIQQGLETEISNAIKQGYTPTGFELLDDSLSILFVKSDEIPFDRWTIQDFEMDGTLNDTLSAVLVDNWLPMGISVRGTTISVLFVRPIEDPRITGWRLHELDTVDYDQILQTFSSYRDDGFVPYGLSFDTDDTSAWALMIQSELPENAEPPRVLLNGFPFEEFVSGVSTDVENGALPWGFARGKDVILVNYIF